MSKFTKSTAVREKVKLMVGFAGPSGSGKTWGALQVAFGITGDWKKITLIDTENKSALYYADRKEFGPFEHIPFDPSIQGGYDPRNYIQAIAFAESDPNCEVIVIDSISHEWEGVGGCLDTVDRINKGFAGWKQVTPLHADFIDRMRHGRCHILATMRTKTDYQVEQINGKATPKKIGLKSNQREGTDYEFGIIFDIEISHLTTASKDRTGMFGGKGPVQLSPEIGKQLVAWANGGVVAAAAPAPGAAASSTAPASPAAAPAGLKNVPASTTFLAKNKEHQEMVLHLLTKGKTAGDLHDEICTRLDGKPFSELRAIRIQVEKDFAAYQATNPRPDNTYAAP